MDEIHGTFECGDRARNSARYAGNYLGDIHCIPPGAVEHLLEQYTYDNVGRIKTRAHATQGQTSYDWDDRGYLIQVTRPGTVITYTYDALGQRKTKTVNGVTTRYVTAPIFGMSHVLMELDASNGIQRTYIYGGNQQLGEEPVATNRAADRYLLQGGSVGNITHAVNRAGVIENEYGYDAFGMRTNVTTTGASTRYGYTGEHYDEETGLLYLRARYYDPMIGRFISVDPYRGRLEEPSTQNRYTYVHNNPILYVDPVGLAVYLTGHELIPGSGISHYALMIIPDNPPKGTLTDGTWKIGQAGDGIAEGKFYRTISAGPDMAGFGNLVSTPFRSSDSPSANQIYDVVMPPVGMNDADFERNLITLDKSYRNDAPYDFFRGYAGAYSIESSGWNSNSYVTGLLSAAEGRWAESFYNGSIFPLSEYPLPTKYFGVSSCPGR